MMNIFRAFIEEFDSLFQYDWNDLLLNVISAVSVLDKSALNDGF